jgi:hypothetical protein
MNLGVCALSYVFASQFSWAAKAGDTKPKIRILRTSNDNGETRFTDSMPLGTVINLILWFKNSQKNYKRIFFALVFCGLDFAVQNFTLLKG